MNLLPRRRPSAAMIVALLALFVSLGGSSYAAVRIGSKQIADNSIRSKDVHNNDLRSADIEDGSLLAKDFAPSQLPSGRQGPAGPAGPRGDKGEQGSPGVLKVYRVTEPITLAANDSVRVLPYCDQGDVATGGGYFLNTANKTDAQLDVEVFSNGPNTDRNVLIPPGWDIGIHNKTATARDGFAWAVCAKLAS
jgi:hypothetical protein